MNLNSGASMIFSEILCSLIFIASFITTRQALGLGVAASLAAGYLYGILRANLDSPVGQLVYDAALAGLFLGCLSRRIRRTERARLRLLFPWALALIGWPTLLLFVPSQPFLVQLVGWRGNVLFVPFILIGAALGQRELLRIARCVAVFNLVALAFATAEVFLSVARFYPNNALDAIIFKSSDVYFAGAGHLRIPATFTHSAAYASTMLATLPLLFGGFRNEQSRWRQRLFLSSIAASGIGVFLAASRSAAVELLIFLVGISFINFRSRLTPRYWILAVSIVAAVVGFSPRMQRFETLTDLRMVKDRLHESVNGSLIDLLIQYPLGNGLGGGGTSMPYYLSGQVHNPVGIENEYSRLLAEQGLPGLLMWLGFVVWLLKQRPLVRSSSWTIGWRLARIYCAISFVTAQLGTGMLNAIPQSAFLMIYAGWIVSSSRSL